MGLRAEIVDLRGLHLPDDISKIGCVGKIPIMEDELYEVSQEYLTMNFRWKKSVNVSLYHAFGTGCLAGKIVYIRIGDKEKHVPR